MELHPCSCGEGRLTVTSDDLLQDLDGGLVRRRKGTCPGCQHPREFIFGVPETLESGGASWELFFGGDKPSQIIDAGEWLDIAQRLAKSVPQSRSFRPGKRREGREVLTEAVAATNEVLKFIPIGADEVPDEAFWSDRGQQKRDENTEQFRREALARFRDDLVSSLDKVGGPLYHGYEISGRMP
jgi:hypothetical protein